MKDQIPLTEEERLELLRLDDEEHETEWVETVGVDGKRRLFGPTRAVMIDRRNLERLRRRAARGAR